MTDKKSLSERLPRRERGSSGGRDHHESGAREETADERSHQGGVQAVEWVDPHEHAVSHTVGDVRDGEAQARQPIVARSRWPRAVRSTQAARRPCLRQSQTPLRRSRSPDDLLLDERCFQPLFVRYLVVRVARLIRNLDLDPVPRHPQSWRQFDAASVANGDAQQRWMIVSPSPLFVTERRVFSSALAWPVHAKRGYDTSEVCSERLRLEAARGSRARGRCRTNVRRLCHMAIISSQKADRNGSAATGESSRTCSAPRRRPIHRKT